MSQSISTGVTYGDTLRCPLLRGVLDELSVQGAVQALIEPDPSELLVFEMYACDVSDEATHLRILHCLQAAVQTFSHSIPYPVAIEACAPKKLTAAAVQQCRTALAAVLADIQIVEAELGMCSDTALTKWRLSVLEQGAVQKTALLKIFDAAELYLATSKAMHAAHVGALFVRARVLRQHYHFTDHLHNLINISATNWISAWKKSR